MAKPLMSIRLPEEKQSKWSEKADELGLDSRTELIETAVETYIAQGGLDEEGQFAQREAINALHDTANRLEDAMEEIREEVRVIKRQTAKPDEGVKDLAHHVLELLPPIDEDRDPREYQQYPKPLSEYEPAEVDIPVTADALLSWLRKDPEVDPGYPLTRGGVEESLEFLEGQYLARSQEIGGETRWVKEV